MSKISQIAQYEFKSALGNKWFVFMGIIFPIILGLVFLVVTNVRDSSEADDVDKTQIEHEGYVDYSGIIKTIPEDLPKGILTEFSDEAGAQAALQSNEISAYYIIPDDYVTTGNLISVRPDYNLLEPGKQVGIIEWIIKQNLVGNEELAVAVQEPLVLKQTDLVLVEQGSQDTAEDCSRPGPQCKSNEFVSYIPLIIVVIFYMLLITAAGLIIRGVGKEKENRVMEILMTSVTPKQILAGKTMGLGLFALLQFISWIGIFYAILTFGGQSVNLPSDFSLPIGVLTWGFVYFIFGYALYALLLAGAGAMISRVKEIQVATFTVITPLLIGYLIMLTYGMEHPHGPLTIGVSLFPFTSPMAMMHRLSIGDVPLWQPIVGLVLLVATVYLVNNLMARLFKAQNLLSGQPFSLKRFFRAIFRK